MSDNYYSENCRCDELARAYIKFQVMNQVFNQREALKAGTLFPELYMPYVPCERDKGGKYHG